jgi:hypothetical protein
VRGGIMLNILHTGMHCSKPLNTRENIELIFTLPSYKNHLQKLIFLQTFFRKIYHDLNISLADKVREYAYENYIKPARDSGQDTVTIKSGVIHNELGLENKIPSVCGALDTKKVPEKI